ncbi:MAG: T9SS type A sorting domain-containing protein [Bacteroidia bacterium]|nr:T9SS type A sorting domain-containing protein [Bacteroidia bacterium]
MQLKNIVFILFTFISFITFSQVKVGQWRDHLSYDNINSVTKVGSVVYASNGSGLLKYNEGDNSIEKLTKIDGLSDVGVKLLRKNEYNNSVLVIYDNTNIDVVMTDGRIINISDIKRKIIQGKKYINEVYFSGSLAYISCGFGIVVFDTEKMEVKDTYYLGNGITNLEIYQVTKNDTAVFAATASGVFYGKNSLNLSNYQNWKSLNVGIASGPYNSIVNFNGKIITNYSEKVKSNQDDRDTLYELTNLGWAKYSLNMNYSGNVNKKLFDYSKFNKLLILDKFGLAEYTATGQRINYLTDYGFNDYFYAQINDFYYENNNKFWVGDKRHGLIKSGGAPWTPNDKIRVNGPSNNLANDIAIKDGYFVVAPVYLGEVFNSQYSMEKPNVFSDGEWKSLSVPDSIRDMNAVAIDPNDKDHVVFACMASGIMEVRSNQVQGFYTYANSPLIGYNGTNDVRITGVNFDKSSKLWASITLGKKCIAVKKTNNAWTLLDFEQFVVNPTVSKIIFDKQDQAWIVLPRNLGLMIYKDVNGLSQPNSSNTKLLSISAGNGKLPSVDVHSICEDKDGHIWVGTAKGIAVFYNPENVFTGANWDSQQILIEQDGHVQILLENDVVTSIAVDGVNRKWIGTESSGVYCFSSDGQEEIYHFTEENSPLYSDLIKDIVTDETSGDIFIATDKGIQTYRTPIIKGFEEYTNVHAYPNPIRPGTSTPVYITGLVDESDVKITDVSGNLIWSTKSQGGQVVWNLQSFAGTKAASGVYMIYCSTANGDKSATAKLLIVN